MPTYAIEVRAGPLTASRQTQNANMTAILEAYVAAHDGPVAGTAQEKLDFIVSELARQVIRDAQRHHWGKARLDAAQQAKQEVREWDWNK